MLTLCVALLLADPVATTTTLQVAPAVTIYGEPTAFNAHVFATADVTAAHGSVQILDGAVLIDSETLNSDGRVSISIMNLSVGEHAFTAQFVPADDSLEAASTSSEVDHDVEQAGAQIVVTLHDVDTIGRTVIGIRVVALSPSLGTPTGDVTLYLDDVDLADAHLTQGVVSIPTRKLHVGNRAVSVHYSGDANYTETDSPVTALIIPPEQFDAIIDPDNAKMAPGDTRNFTLTLTPTVQRDSQVSFVCRNLPAGTTCAFDPPQLTLQADPQTVGVTVSIEGELFPVAGLALAGGALSRKRRRKVLASTALFACLACGDARPVGHVAVQVTAVSENISKAAALTLEIR